MKVLYKCKKNRWASWAGEKDKEETEAYYIELTRDELTEKLGLLLKKDKEQMEYQLERFNKLYIVVDKYLEFAFYVPSGYGPHWPISGHWDMSDNFTRMEKEINTIDEIKYL